MEENAKKPRDGSDKTLSNKLHALLRIFNLIVVDKYILLCNKYILLFRLIIYILYSFNPQFLHFLYKVPLHPYCGMSESFIN